MYMVQTPWIVAASISAHATARPSALFDDWFRSATLREHDPEKACPGLDPGWEPVFGKRSCSSNKLEQDDDSKKSHPALAHPLSGSASEGSERRSPGTLGREVPGLLYPGSPLIPGWTAEPGRYQPFGGALVR